MFKQVLPNERKLTASALRRASERPPPEETEETEETEKTNDCRIDPAVLRNAEISRRQFRARPRPHCLLAASAIGRLAVSTRRDKREVWRDVVTFLNRAGTFYDVELLETDLKSFKRRMARWKSEQRRTLQKQRSNVDVGQTRLLDKLYSRTTNNESNMYKGRNTTADVLDATE